SSQFPFAPQSQSEQVLFTNRGVDFADGLHVEIIAGKPDIQFQIPAPGNIPDLGRQAETDVIVISKSVVLVPLDSESQAAAPAAGGIPIVAPGRGQVGLLKSKRGAGDIGPGCPAESIGPACDLFA